MQQASLLSHLVRQPSPLPIKIITQFESSLPNNDPQPDLVLARMFLYTKQEVYRGQVTRGDINSQLAWNQKSIAALHDSLGGKRAGVEIRFNQKNGKMALICEIQTSIRVTLFEVQFIQLQGQQPLKHMKKVFLSYRELYSEQQTKLKHEKDKITAQSKEMYALSKQIEQQAQYETIHMKKKFIQIVNQCKKQLRKHMKSGIMEINQEEEEEEEQKNRKKRTIVRVNQRALQEKSSDRNGESNMMEIEADQRGFQNIFD